MQTLFSHFLHISCSNSKAVLLNCLFLNPFVFILYQHLPPGSNCFLVATPPNPLDGPPAPGHHCSDPTHTHHCLMGLPLSHSPNKPVQPYMKQEHCPALKAHFPFQSSSLIAHFLICSPPHSWLPATSLYSVPQTESSSLQTLLCLLRPSSGLIYSMK